MSAGATLLDSGSLAYTFQIDTTPYDLEGHAEAVKLLLTILCDMDRGQDPTLRVLHATACSPAAVLAWVRRLLPSQGAEGHVQTFIPRWYCRVLLQGALGFKLPVLARLPSRIAPPDLGRGSCHALEILVRGPLFLPERTATGEDRQLQARIVAQAAADLRRLAAVHVEGSMPSAVYAAGAVAMNLLPNSLVHTSTAAAVHGGPALVDAVVAATELFLRLDPPEGLGPERHSVQRATLLHAIFVMYISSWPTPDAPPRLLPFKDALRCIGAAAAAAIRVLLDKGDQKELDRAARVVHGLLNSIRYHYLLPGDSIPPGTDVGGWAAHYCAVEGLLRLTALMPPSWPEEVLTDLGAVLLAIYPQRPAVPPGLQQQAWSDVAGLAESALKCALRASGPGTEGHGDHARRLDLSNGMIYSVADSCDLLKGQAGAEGFPLR